VVTVEQVKALLDGNEPGRGDYGSEFEYEQREDKVLVTFLAEWRPRYEKQEFLVSAVTEETLTFTNAEGDDEPETQEVLEFCDETCGDAD